LHWPFFAKSLVAGIAKEELLLNSTMQNGLSPEFFKKLRNVGENHSPAISMAESHLTTKKKRAVKVQGAIS
jgi:hypothetical protein